MRDAGGLLFLVSRGLVFCRMPRRLQLLSAPNHCVNDCGFSRGLRCQFEFGCNIQFCQASKHRLQSTVFVTEKEAAANPHKLPSKSFKNCLTLGVFLKLLRPVVSLAVTFHGETATVSSDDQIDPIGPYMELWKHVVVRLHEAAKDALLKGRLGTLQPFSQFPF